MVNLMNATLWGMMFLSEPLLGRFEEKYNYNKFGLSD